MLKNLIQKYKYYKENTKQPRCDKPLCRFYKGYDVCLHCVHNRFSEAHDYYQIHPEVKKKLEDQE